MTLRHACHAPTLGRFAALAAGLLATALAAAAPCPTPQRAGDGIYLIAARTPEASRANRGRSGNSVILLGKSGITIIDPGPTLKSGRELACSVRRLSRLPVVALIDTHPHPEQVLANGAFPGVPIFASRTAAETMQSRCASCRARLEKTLGEREMAGTAAVIPDQRIDGETRLRPGGRALRLLPQGNAHSHGDLAVLDEATGTLVSGDLGNSATLPDLRDADTAGWIAALQRLIARPDVARVIPGFGPPAPPAALERPLRYLQAVRQIAEQEVASGNLLPPQTVPEALQAFGGSADTHSLNLQHAMREAEERWWSTSPEPSPAAPTR